MSEAIIADLHRQLAEARAEIVRVNGEAKEHRLKRRKAEELKAKFEKQVEALSGDLDKFKAKVSEAPKEKDAEIERLLGEIRTRDHRDAWGSVKDQLQDKVSIEKVWSEIGYTPGDKPPTPEQIAEQVSKARETAPYLFKPAGDGHDASRGAQSQESAVLPPGPGFGRGLPSTHGGMFTYRTSDLQDYAWVRANTAALAEAQAQGRARRLD